MNKLKHFLNGINLENIFLQERKRRREKKLEEDQKFLNELKQIEEKEDEIKQKARFVFKDFLSVKLTG